MGKMGVAAAATGFTGTGAAGIYGAHHMGVFGGGKSQVKAVVALTGKMEGEKAPFANECLKNIFQDASVESNLPSLEPNFT